MESLGYTNLVFEGGGMLGAAFARVPEALEKYGILKNVTRVSGSSAGSIAATLIALRYSASDINRIVTNMRFDKFTESWWQSLINVLRFGYMNSGQQFERWIRDRIMMRVGNPDVTFYELYNKTKIELVITGTNIDDDSTEYFSYRTTPNMQVWRAVRISMSIPAYFKAIEHNGKTYVDGGILANYPIWVFDGQSYENMDDTHNPDTLGFVLVPDKAMVRNKQTDDPYPIPILSMLAQVMYLLLGNIYNLTNTKENISRTIKIGVFDAKSLDFKMPSATVERLKTSGYQATCKWLRAREKRKKSTIGNFVRRGVPFSLRSPSES
jgi:NTE family protein